MAEGEDAKFIAVLLNQDYEHVHWERNETTLANKSKKYDIRQDLLTGRHNLIIENCKKSDEAIYGCVAGTEVTSARLYVESKFHFFHFSIFVTCYFSSNVISL